MQEIRSSNPPAVAGISDPNSSRARHHRSLNEHCSTLFELVAMKTFLKLHCYLSGSLYKNFQPTVSYLALTI